MEEATKNQSKTIKTKNITLTIRRGVERGKKGNEQGKTANDLAHPLINKSG
jgi:hypothetical protein